MMTVIIHGGDVVASLKKLDEMVGKFPEMAVVRASEEEITEEFLVNNLRGQGLFEEKRLVILENPSPDLDLEKYGSNDNVWVVLFFDKNLPAASSFLKLKEAKIFSFEKPPDKTIFTFLDLLGEKNPKAFRFFDRLFDEFGDQYLLTMIFYLFRRQIVINDKLPASIKTEMARQRQNFPVERLKELYHAALETDYKIKTGLIEPKIGLFLLVERIVNN